MRSIASANYKINLQNEQKELVNYTYHPTSPHVDDIPKVYI